MKSLLFFKIENLKKRSAGSVKTQHDSSYRTAHEDQLNVKSQKKKAQLAAGVMATQSNDKKKMNILKSFHQDNNRGKNIFVYEGVVHAFDRNDFFV